jgi:outer membrane protein assembly factor BamB
MKNFLLLFVLGCMIPVCANAQADAQWRGPDRDGIYPETGLLKSWPEAGPALLWHFDELGQGHASAAVTADRVYTAGTLQTTGYLFCFDLDGKPVWKVPYGEEWTESWPGVRSTPLVHNGKVYLVSGFGKLVCRRADNGNLVWTVDVLKDFHGQNIKWGVTENLLIDDNKLFCTVGGADTNVVALNPENGRLIWVSKGKGEPSAYCSPIMVKLPARNILVTHTASSIIGIDAANGKLLWSHPQPNRWSVHANSPTYRDGQVYCMSGYGQGGVMLKLSEDGSSVKELWRNTNIDHRMGGTVVINGKIFGSDDPGKAWYCLDWKTGTPMHSEKITGKGNIIAAEGMLYMYGDNGEIVLAEAQANSFRKVSAFKVPYGTDQHWAFPVIANGRLYVRHGNSLMVYDIRRK